MKVTLPKDYRKWFTYEDMDRAKAVIANAKENESISIADYAAYAAQEFMSVDNRGLFEEVLTATAEVRKNCNLIRNNRYNYWKTDAVDTEDMDIWVSFTAKVWYRGEYLHTKLGKYGFIEGGAYLSDIHQTGGEKYGWKIFANEYIDRNDD